MTGRRRGGAPLAVRAYTAALRAYPADFRDDHAEQAARDFAALYGDRRASAGRLGAVLFGVRSIGLALAGAAAERWSPTGADLSSSHPSLERQRWTAMRHDFKYALRTLRKRPGFAATVVLLLATGIGSTTAVFSVVDSVLLKRLPYPEPDRLIYLDNGSHSAMDIQDWQREVESIDTWGGMWFERADLTGDGPPARLGVGLATRELFGLLGARSTLGRLFTPEDHVGQPAVAVLSHGLWRDRWGSDPELLGKQVQLGDMTVTIVGVMSPDFVPPRTISPRGGADVWLPLDIRRPDLQERGLHVIQLVGRLAPGFTADQADAEMLSMNEAFADRFPERRFRDGTFPTTPVLALRDAEVGGVQGTLVMLLGAVGLLLLLACANVANLLLARGADRTREMALRGALGATRRNVLAQLTAESLLLALAGGAVGIAFAFLGVKLFSVLEPGVIPRTESVSVDLRVLGFATFVSVATGLLFGLVPALQASRVEANAALKEGSGQSTGTRRRSRLQGSLVVSEVAVSLVLLTGAGLLFHSFLKLTSVEPGFESRDLVTVDLQLREPYDAEARVRFTEELMRRLRAIPETRAVVAGNTLPFQYPSGGNCCWRSSVIVAGAPDDSDVPTSMYPVTPGYLSGLEIPLVAGRDIQPGDEDVDPLPVVLGEHAAERLFGEEDPLGETLDFSRMRATVVGVARDVRHQAFDRDVAPTMYLPWEAVGTDMPYLNIALRTNLDDAAVAPAVRAAIWDLDSNLPVPDIVSMEGRMARSVADERFYSAILAAFATVALLLAAGGVYATFLYSVRQRVREMGIRLALGARRTDVVRLVLRRGFVLTSAGIVVGLVAAAVGARVLATMVFGITPHDPVTYGAVSGLMAAVAIGACLVPAVRAGRTDPIETLRAE
ncbi:MAG: ABC transporter permease [Gemmatimonadota bacterium]|nr:ABC transporter permease [Gemmatimonadota bacterium]